MFLVRCHQWAIFVHGQYSKCPPASFWVLNGHFKSFSVASRHLYLVCMVSLFSKRNYLYNLNRRSFLYHMNISELNNIRSHNVVTISSTFINVTYSVVVIIILYVKVNKTKHFLDIGFKWC